MKLRIYTFLLAIAWLFCSFGGPTALAQSVVIDGVATANISWTAPTQREDGSALPASDVDGYLVFFGQQSRAGRCDNSPVSKTDVTCYANVIDVTTSTDRSRTFTFPVTQSTTVFFAMSTYDGAGRISRYSAEVSRGFVVTTSAAPNAPTSVTVTVTVTCSTNVPGVTCSIQTN